MSSEMTPRKELSLPDLGIYVYSRTLDGREDWIVSAANAKQGLTKEQAQRILDALTATPPAAKEADPELATGLPDYATFSKPVQASKCPHGCVDGKVKTGYVEITDEGPVPFTRPCPIHGEGHGKPAAQPPKER